MLRLIWVHIYSFQMKNTPLMVACQSGYCDIALLLALHIENISHFDAKNRVGLSALHYAYRMKCYDVADVLISKGARIDIADQVLYDVKIELQHYNLFS